MNRVKVEWAPAPGKVLSGTYTLSRGITPSAISLTCSPFDGTIPAISDVKFIDGGTTLTFKDCRFVSRQPNGKEWAIQLLDRRWRWKLATCVGEYNRLINITGYLSVNEKGQASPEELADTKGARALAKELLAAMSETDYDVDAITDKDFPEVKWDHTNPAEELARLCDSYGLVICYDPQDGRITVEAEGEGEDLPAGPTMLSDGVGDIEPLKPKTLRAVCAHMQHEEEFALEPVGLDTDGSIKHIDNLTYRPGSGWSSDFLLMSGVPEDAIADPMDPGKTTTKRELAGQCIYRWYRIVPRTIQGWRRWGSEWKKTTPRLDWLLPVSGELMDVYVVADPADSARQLLKHKQATVRGVHAADWKAMGQTNSAATETVKEGFNLDENTGVVKFSQPVFQWSSGLVLAADLHLRCVVSGDRYIREKSEGGPFGVETLDCAHLTLKYRDGAPLNLVGDLGVDVAVDRIFALRERDYAVTKSGSRTYVGLMDLMTDGKTPQTTWSVGPQGATTQASTSSEHNPWVPSEAQRRMTEKQVAAAKEFQDEF